MGDSMSTIINATTTNGVVIQPDNSGSLQLQTNSGTTAVTVDTSQRVGIGTTSPSQVLTVNGRLSFSNLFSASDIDGIFLQSGVGTTINTATGNNITFNNGTTERMRITSAGLLQFNSGYGSVATAYGCRAWVKFNGTGTVAINASGGVTSITDNGTGDYTVNFSITFPDANYALGATCDADTVNGAVCYMNSTSAPTTTTCRLATKLLNNSSIDRERIMALFIR